MWSNDGPLGDTTADFIVRRNGVMEAKRFATELWLRRFKRFSKLQWNIQQTGMDFLALQYFENG